VDVRVAEARNDHASAQIDHLRRGERRLVDADAARDPVPGHRERPLRRDGRLQRADEATLEDHGFDTKIPATIGRIRGGVSSK
jgi:hypothetical protein